jgi:lipoprotein-anchoring transpeptidase ErfK/SrfK
VFTSLPFLLAATLVAPQSGVETLAALPDTLSVQVMLQRAGHSPGVLDGTQGTNTRRAIAAFERANDLPVDGIADPRMLEGLKVPPRADLFQDYTVTAADVDRLAAVPQGMAEQSKLPHLGFETALEALAEKFHMSQGLMERLNPGADFASVGTALKVVAPVARDLPAKVAKIEVDKVGSELRAFDASGKLLASYPATVGSADFPSPNGEMEVRAVAATPTYYFNPEGRSWGPDERLTIAAGPNNPVGSTWIDLSRPGYGIHGTPQPELIGKTSSHGCVRLTNWDVAQLSRAVTTETSVVFTS